MTSGAGNTSFHSNLICDQRAVVTSIQSIHHPAVSLVYHSLRFRS